MFRLNTNDIQILTYVLIMYFVCKILELLINLFKKKKKKRKLQIINNFSDWINNENNSNNNKNTVWMLCALSYGTIEWKQFQNNKKENKINKTKGGEWKLARRQTATIANWTNGKSKNGEIKKKKKNDERKKKKTCTPCEMCLYVDELTRVCLCAVF